MPEVERVLSGFWVWVGDHVIGEEVGRFVAIHKSGSAQINVKFGDYPREQAAREIVDRVGSRKAGESTARNGSDR